MTAILSQDARPRLQQPDWPDEGVLAEVRGALESRPPLVTEDETAQLSVALAAVERREALVVQGGDCAELFGEAVASLVRPKLGQMYGLSEMVRVSTGLPVATIGRLAGQYAKPRSSPAERIANGVTLPSYRGDAVNDAAPNASDRRPDPCRLLRAYDAARVTLQEIRRSWVGRPVGNRLFTSHELLLLDYELPLVRAARGGRFTTSAHFGWIGDRTRGHDGEHVAFGASLRTPLAVKVGPTATPDEVVSLARRLNPDRVPGGLSFITRMGAERIEQVLPPIVEAVARTGIPVIWLCDPMHANTVQTAGGLKTRQISSIDREVAAFVRVLRANGQWPGGLHLELTPQDVTECVADPQHAASGPALTRYRSACDPRLNPGQAADVVGRFVALL
jgi:3-deoxy-7-phosphoheptulonate synthase